VRLNCLCYTFAERKVDTVVNWLYKLGCERICVSNTSKPAPDLIPDVIYCILVALFMPKPQVDEGCGNNAKI